MNWHAVDAKEVLQKIGSSKNGLSESEAVARLKKHGPNKLQKKHRIEPFKILARQFKNFLVLILIFAAVISYLIGDFVDAFMIGVIVVVNALLGFLQEFRAEKAMIALEKMGKDKAIVLRDGEERTIDASKIVPGDIIVLSEGENVPADARVIQSVNMKVDEAVLTGESTPVEKSSKALPEEFHLSERKNILYKNTDVVYGRGLAVVVATGMDTEFGKIAEMIHEFKEIKTPLTERLDNLGKFLGKLVIGIAVLLIALDFFKQTLDIETVMLAVSLAVAAIPEGLPAVVTITLALGMRAMAKNKAVVRKIAAVETLGSTSVICSDKTGTLTRNELTVRKVWAGRKEFSVGGRGYSAVGAIKPLQLNSEFEALVKTSVLCNNASLGDEKDEIVGDPTEIALLVLGEKAGQEKHSLEKKYSFVNEIPFSSERKRMTVILKNHASGKLRAFSKGGAETVLERCGRISLNGKEHKLSEKQRNEIIAKNNEMAMQGLRVLAFAFRELDGVGEFNEESVERNLVFLGLAGMIDAPRAEAKHAVELCHKAGIEVKMVTGDHVLTAKAVAEELGILYGDLLAVEGRELEKMSDRELEEKVGEIAVFARVSPEHKVRIIEALRKKGHTIAMTGDGVNDAPALKKADIGIAMGLKGTDVAKEASDMVIEDDNFATIVKAVEEGRRIYSNIRSFVKYLLSANFGEVIVITLAMLLEIFITDIPLPLIPVQILWINLVTDGLPALALGNEPLQGDEMNKKPRPKEQHILHGMLPMILVAGLVCALATFGAFFYGLGESTLKAQTMAFTTIIFFELMFVFNCRAEGKTVFELNLLGNKSLITAVVASIMLQIAVLYIPILQHLFSVTALSAQDWVLVLVLAASALAIPYILRAGKALKR